MGGFLQIFGRKEYFWGGRFLQIFGGGYFLGGSSKIFIAGGHDPNFARIVIGGLFSTGILVNVRPVRILLECILVLYSLHLYGNLVPSMFYISDPKIVFNLMLPLGDQP